MIRERKVHTNFFCTNFLNTPTGLGHPGKIPGTSQIPLSEIQGSQTFEGEHELFGHQPFAWKTPTPPGGFRTQKVNLCSEDFSLLVTFLLVTFSWFFRVFFVAFPWLFRGPHLLGKTVFGHFSWLFRGFFVVLSWFFRGFFVALIWANSTRTRPRKVFWFVLFFLAWMIWGFWGLRFRTSYMRKDGSIWQLFVLYLLALGDTVPKRYFLL